MFTAKDKRKKAELKDPVHFLISADDLLPTRQVSDSQGRRHHGIQPREEDLHEYK